MVLGVSRGRVHQILKTVNQRRLEEESGAAGPFLNLHQRVRKHLLSEFPGDAYPPLGKVRELMATGALKKVPNLGKLLSASNMFDGLICTLCEGLGLMRQIRLRARRLTPTA